jgi:O-antigen/teichoic acid export membrane protein
MIAILGIVLLVVAAIFELVKQHLDLVIWLIIIGAILIGVEVSWGWNRGGRYNRNNP